jgi:molybdopterin-binding protein
MPSGRRRWPALRVHLQLLLVAVGPEVGSIRAVAAARELALAPGYDVSAAFESADEDVD